MPSGIIINIQGDGSGAAEALRMIEEKMKETGERGTEMSEQLQLAGERIERALEYTGIYFGIEEVISSFKELLKGTVELGMEIGHLSQQTGISTENLSVLKYASEQTGVSFEALQKGFKKLSTELFEYQEGAKEAKDAFGLLGISQKDLSATGGDVYRVLELVAQRMSQMPDGWKKNAAATQLFGRAGAELIPVLNQGAAGLERLQGEAQSFGLVLSEETIAKMEEVYQSSQRLHGALQGIGIQIETGLAPSLANLNNALAQANGGMTGWEQVGVVMGDIVKGVTTTFDALGAVVMTVGDAIVDSTEAMARFAKVGLDITTGQFKTAWSDAKKGGEDYKEMLIDIRNEWVGFADDQKRLWSQIQSDPSHRPGGSPGAPQPAGKDSAEKIAKAIQEREDKIQKEIAENQRAADAASLRMQKALIEQEEAEAKSGAQTQIAILDAQHTAGLVADQDYYARKLKLREDELDAEQKAIQEQEEQLRAARKNAADGSKEQADIDTELVQLETKLVELADRRRTIEEQTAIQMRVSRDIPSGGTSVYAVQQQDQIAAGEEHARMASETIGRMLEQVASMRGKDPLRELVDSMVQDLERLALKVMEEQWIIPMMQRIFAPNLPNVMSGSYDPLGLNAPTLDVSGMASGMGLPAFAGGGDISGPALVGEEGPEIFAPSGPGTILPNDVLEGLAKSGGGGAPNVTINNTNNSSQPVQMRQTGVSYDSELKEFVVHTVLEDMTQGGAMAQAMRGFGG